MTPAVFLDRDGVIIENRAEYVRRWADVAFLPGALAALARLAHSSFPIIIVTNQSAVGRGLLPLAEAEAINGRIVATVSAAGGRIDAVYMCPHTPADDCPCRKPRPGMLLQAARERGLELGRSLLIGDSISDLLAARAAGLTRFGLVRTGLGATQAEQPQARLFSPLPLYDGLAAALAALLDWPNGQ
jgi:D-glycero-D-manno-heptose 1,7-bisphosphate phosphatase